MESLNTKTQSGRCMLVCMVIVFAEVMRVPVIKIEWYVNVRKVGSTKCILLIIMSVGCTNYK